ncbi:hypothetical protein GYMLUDRAFT_64164 [Collybiopsis luxurians FD-317 M1]|uniref:Uncharacterized protein n=1 Tax=Collybiopsis luxurians FD-317 M1 TaxID=944289 RepID=A0A0D0C406_9AGAR|nr:hypothetical protein GYMLUDRAFT_64164 [Collybiopsis luxurians FD-317 M1]
MFFFGVLQEGLRGPEGVANVAGTFVQSEEHIDNLQMYGVDWEDLADPGILRHHHETNLPDVEMLGHHSSRQPVQLLLVEVPEFICPFETDEQLEAFVQGLVSIPEYGL